MLNLDTFNRWASYHESCFAGFIKFLADTADRSEIWRQAFEGFSVDELKMASYDLYTKREKPPGYSSHMDATLAILKASRTAKQEPANASHYAHVCGLCCNQGLFSVIAKPGCEFPNDNGGVFPRERHSSVACKCSAGDKFRERESDVRGRKQLVGFRDYDATRMEPWFAWRLRERPHPRDAEFAEKAKHGTKAAGLACKQVVAASMGITSQPLPTAKAAP